METRSSSLSLLLLILSSAFLLAPGNQHATLFRLHAHPCCLNNALFAFRGNYKVGSGTEDLVHIEAFVGRCDTGGQLELRVLPGGLQHTAERLRLLLPGHAHVARFCCHEPLLPITRPELLELLLQGLRPPCHYRPQSVQCIQLFTRADLVPDLQPPVANIWMWSWLMQVLGAACTRLSKE